MLIKKILNSRLVLVFFMPFFLGLLTVFTFQPFNFTIINFLIIPSLFLMLTYVNKKSKNIYRKKPYLINLFLIGYLFGIGFFLSGTYWISYSLSFDENFRHLIPFTIIILPLFLGLFFGLGSLIFGPFLKNNFTSILFFCASFAFIDYLRSKVLTGFPWNLWAYSWSWSTEILQTLNIFGLFAFNLLTITIFCSPLFIIIKKRYNLSIFFILTFLFFSNYIYGSYTINKNNKELNISISSKKVATNIKLVSPNFDLKHNLSHSDIKQLILKLIRYSEPENKETIFVWPEGVFTGYSLLDIKKYESLFKEKFLDQHTIVFGVNTYDVEKNKYFNSLIAVNNRLEVIYQYNKKKLVPFGEFLPFENYLNKFGLKKITHGYGSFAEGNNQANLTINNLNILPLICYEIIFPELVQKADKKTNLIINISEDAWFGGSIGPHQHFVKAIFRAIESNIFLARSANQGVSAFIDNKGRVLKRLEPNERGNIELNIPTINSTYKNKNDLIFFVLLFTYIIIFLTLRNKLK